MARLGSRIADMSERWFPDAYVFALAAVLVVFILGMFMGEAPSTLVDAFGNGFWILVPFTMQMVMIIITGFVVASSPPVARLIDALASVPRTGRGAVAYVALFAMVSSLLSWGFSLVFTGLLVRAIARRIERVDYRAIGAAAYLGLGSVWALGLSSSSALMQATRSSIPDALFPITGVIPLTHTIFTWQNALLSTVLIAMSVAIAWSSAPADRDARSFASAGVVFEPLVRDEERGGATPAERLEQSPVLIVLVAGLMIAWLATQFVARGWRGAIDLNNFNLAFLAAGMLLHWRPARFLRAVGDSVPAVAGVLIQFPFYAGIFGMIANTGVEGRLSRLFVDVAGSGAFNVFVSIYSIILGIFIPSGGGKWVVEAPYVMTAARELGQHLGWTVQTYNAAETLPNLLNPFWMLPLMGILNVRARDLAGYSILQFLFHTPVVIILCWLLSFTFAYVPPILD